MDTFNSSLPPQNLPYSKKNREWRKRHLDFADSKSFLNYELVRKSVAHKVINRDLMNGILHMKDLQLVLNPQHIESELLYSQERIPHFPIMNSKLNVLRGEESKRLFDYNVIVTNPNAISEME